MSRGGPHSERTNHPAEPLGGRPECQRGYAGPGRTPQHPIHAIAGTDHDIEAKRMRASRGETMHRTGDVPEDDSEGLIVRRNNKIAVVTGEIADSRESLKPRFAVDGLESLSLGGRIKCLRRSLGLSLGRFAVLVGASEWSIMKWEANERQPVVGVLVAMATVLNIHPGALLDGLGPDGAVSC